MNKAAYSDPSECPGSIITCQFEFTPNWAPIITLFIMILIVFILVPYGVRITNRILFGKIIYKRTLRQVLSCKKKEEKEQSHILLAESLRYTSFQVKPSRHRRSRLYGRVDNVPHNDRRRGIPETQELILVRDRPSGMPGRNKKVQKFEISIFKENGEELKDSEEEEEEKLMDGLRSGRLNTSKSLMSGRFKRKKSMASESHSRRLITPTSMLGDSLLKFEEFKPNDKMVSGRSLKAMKSLLSSKSFGKEGNTNMRGGKKKYYYSKKRESGGLSSSALMLGSGRKLEKDFVGSSKKHVGFKL